MHILTLTKMNKKNQMVFQFSDNSGCVNVLFLFVYVIQKVYSKEEGWKSGGGSVRDAAHSN